MAYGTSSGVTNFSPFASELLIDAYDRLKIFDLASKHLQSGRRSINLLLTSSWSNKGANLWRLQEIVIPLIPGVITYNLDRNVATVYDTFRRQYQMNAAQNYPVSFTTQIGSPNVTINLPGNSSPVGTYIGVNVQVSVGGLVLYGFYLVTATPTTNSVTINAGSNATASVTNGGLVPIFTATLGNQNVSVRLDNHGFAPGQPFNVPVSTMVGGIQVFGSYTIQTVTDINNFVIQANANALSNGSAAENGGMSFIATQNQVAPYSDIATTQLSRTDYVEQANKTAPGAPTTLWVNKQIIPQFSVWPVTDNTGPYEMHIWAMVQIEDVNPSGGQTVGIPPRFYLAFVLDLAKDLSMKFAPERYNDLDAAATKAWLEAEGTDVEPTSTWLLPQFPSGLG